MNKNLLWILVNILILSAGILVGTYNERIKIMEVNDEFMTPFMEEYATLTKSELEVKYSRYLDYINVEFDDLYNELATNSEFVVYEKLFNYNIYLTPDGEVTDESYLFGLSMYLGGALPYDYLFIGMVAIINMLGIVLLQARKKYYLHNFMDIATFLTVMILLFFMNSDYGIDTYILVVILHSFVLLSNYLRMVLTGQYRYVIRPEAEEGEKLRDAIQRKKVHFDITSRKSLQGTNYQVFITRKEEEALFNTLAEYIKPYDKKYTMTNTILIGVLSITAIVIFFINLW